MKAGFVSQCVDALQRFDRWMWPRHRVALTPPLEAALRSSRIVVADVGAASGPETRWLPLDSLIHFLTFEPLARAGTSLDSAGRTNFPIALGAAKGRGVLTVMRDPDASTLCRPNRRVLDAFPVGDGLQPVKTVEIELDTLDHCLAATPHLRPDFLKVDVEGADLDVLRGARETLDRSALGIRVEVSFLERHEGAPFFGDTDAYLRARGFALFQLSREHWIRQNGLCGYSSEPQVAWSDAVYFVTRERFLERLQKSRDIEPKLLVAKMAVLLLAHGIHDYALELVETAAGAKFISREWADELGAAIRRSVDRSLLYVVKSFGGVLFALGVYLLAFPLKSSRQRATFYVQQRAGHFSRIVLRMAGRSGPGKSCISD